MIDKKNFGEDLSKFLSQVLVLCDKNSDNLIIDEESWPVFFRDGKFKKVEKKESKDFDYFIRETIRKDIEKLSSYSLITKYLVTPEIKKYNKKLLSDESQIETDFKKNLPLRFIISYLNKNKNFEFNQKNFNFIKDDFFKFIDFPLEDEYVVPLYNFDSDLKQEKVFGDLSIRKITNYEYKVLSNMDDFSNIPIVNKELTEVISVKISTEDLFSGFESAEGKFQSLLDAFLLFSDGNPQFGTIYRNINNPWIPSSKDLEKQIIKQKTLFFKKKDYKKILVIFNHLQNIDFSLKENHFLLIAIGRFRSALTRTDSIDQFLDLMISLEALYAPNDKGEITTKLSNRLVTLVAKNEKDRKDLWLFMKKMYNLRSGVVHGDGIRNTEINGKKYEIDDIRDKIISLVRESLRRYLVLSSKFSGNKKVEKICDEIDLALLDKKNLTQLRSKLK
tara:strand:- start:1848 stop:3188 length:1341 start_codon:yes stop_codon:yes gene_type:complete